jgi:hypothetical protein
MQPLKNISLITYSVADLVLILALELDSYIAFSVMWENFPGYCPFFGRKKDV